MVLLRFSCKSFNNGLFSLQVTIAPEVYKDYSMRPQQLVASFIESRLKMN